MSVPVFQLLTITSQKKPKDDGYIEVCDCMDECVCGPAPPPSFFSPRVDKLGGTIAGKLAPKTLRASRP